MANQPSTIDPDYPPFVFGMIPLRPTRRELFAQKVASGMTAKEAYAATYEGCDESTAENNGPRLLRIASVKERVDYILGKAAEYVEMTKGEALMICMDILRTPIGEIDENHPLAQEMIITESGDKVTTKVKMPSKLDALDKLAKIKSWYAAEKFEGALDISTPEDVAERVQAAALALHGKAEVVQKVLNES